MDEKTQEDNDSNNTGENNSIDQSPREEFKEININDSQHQSEEEEQPEVASNVTPVTLSHSNSVTCSEGLTVTLNNKKIGSFKEWSKNRFTYTKQLLCESLGYGTKTVDNEIEKQISLLYESKAMCTALIAKSKAVLNHMSAMNAAQKDLGLFLSENALKDTSPFKEEMMCNGDMYQNMFKCTDSYESVLRMFISNLTTLNDKTLDDCMCSVRQYEACRVEYDAYRVDYEEAQKSGNEQRIKDSRVKYDMHLSKFNQNRSDLLVKIKLFDENKVKVIKRNLHVLQDTVNKYCTESSKCISEVASHYDFKAISGNSWLENND